MQQQQVQLQVISKQQFQQISNRKQVLLDRFAQLGIQGGDGIAYDRILPYLNQLTGRYFDDQVAEQIVDQCSKDYSGFFKVSEFIDVMLRAYDILESKVQEQQDLEAIFQQMDQAIQNFKSQQTTQNQYGIDSDSQLIVIYQELVGLQSMYQQNGIPFLLFTLGDKKLQSSNGTMQQGIVQWTQNNDLSFRVDTGAENLTIEVMSQDKVNILGECLIRLQDLQTQDKVTNHFTIYSSSGQDTNIKLLLELQYVYDKKQYYRQLFEKLKQMFDTQIQDLLDYYQDLDLIISAFGCQGYYQQEINQLHGLQDLVMNRLQWEQVQNTSMIQQYQQFKGQTQQQQQPNNNNYNNQPNFNSPPPPQDNIQPYSSPQYDNQDYNRQQPAPNQPQSDNKNVIGNFNYTQPVATKNGRDEVSGEFLYFFYAAFALLGLTLFQCFLKPSFLDLTLVFVILFMLSFQNFDKQYMQVILSLTGLSILLDFIWLLWDYNGWWNPRSPEVNNYDTVLQSDNRFVIICTIFGLFTKTGLAWFTYQVYSEFESKWGQKNYFIEFNEDNHFVIDRPVNGRKNQIFEIFEQSELQQSQQFNQQQYQSNSQHQQPQAQYLAFDQNGQNQQQAQQQYSVYQQQYQ